MPMSKKAYIIVPCYNEGSVLRHTLQSLLAAGYEVVVVDDGSKESPWGAISDLPLHFLRHAINLGQGAALQTGMDYCRTLGAEAVVHFDADGQHSVSDISRFLQALDKYDVAMGSRFLRREDKYLVPPFKRMLLACARLVNFCFAGAWLTDAHNGFRALGPKALAAIQITENRMAHATEIVAQVKSCGLSCIELPCTINYTDYSKAKGQKWYNSINIIIDLILNKLL